MWVVNREFCVISEFLNHFVRGNQILVLLTAHYFGALKQLDFPMAGTSPLEAGGEYRTPSSGEVPCLYISWQDFPYFLNFGVLLIVKKQ